MWAIMNSPLIVATDVRADHFTAAKRDILLNAEVIAVNQDPLGAAGNRVGFARCVGMSRGVG